jgi:hypothetical protein
VIRAIEKEEEDDMTASIEEISHCGLGLGLGLGGGGGLWCNGGRGPLCVAARMLVFATLWAQGMKLNRV